MATDAERATIRKFLSKLWIFSEKLIAALSWPNLAEKTRLLLGKILQWFGRLLVALYALILKYTLPTRIPSPRDTDTDPPVALESPTKPSPTPATPPSCDIPPILEPHPKTLVPADNLTQQERKKLLEGVHVLIKQVPNLCGYKLKKSKPYDPHTLRDYAYLFPTEEGKQAFVTQYGDIPLPFSIEISDDGHLFRVLPRSAYRMEGRDVVVKLVTALETHANMLFQADTVFARKRVTLPMNATQAARAARVKEEFEKIPHLLPGYVSMANPFRFYPDTEDGKPRMPTEKCPKIKGQRRLKASVIMPRAPGLDAFEWWGKSQSLMILRSLKNKPNLALNTPGYRFRKYAPLIAASILIAIENFRLHEPNEEWVHRDLKLENIQLQISDTDPVEITTTLIDAEGIAPVSQGVGRLAGTAGYVGKEFYNFVYTQQLFPISPKTDSYAAGIALLLICFDNFHALMCDQSKESDVPYLIKNRITRDRFIFLDEIESVSYQHPEKSKPMLLKPILPASSPDYQSSYQKVKAIASMVEDDPNNRPLSLEVLRSAFMPEVQYLVDSDPSLRNTPAIQSLFNNFRGILHP